MEPSSRVGDLPLVRVQRQPRGDGVLVRAASAEDRGRALYLLGQPRLLILSLLLERILDNPYGSIRRRSRASCSRSSSSRCSPESSSVDFGHALQIGSESRPADRERCDAGRAGRAAHRHVWVGSGLHHRPDRRCGSSPQPGSASDRSRPGRAHDGHFDRARLSCASRHRAIAFTIATANYLGRNFAAAVIVILVVNGIVCPPYITWQRRRAAVAVRVRA